MKLAILLDDDRVHYNPGSPITGDLVMQLDAATSVRSISIFMNGDGYVFWSTGGRRSQLHMSGEKYVCHEIVVYDSRNGPERVFPSGTIHFGYEFVIPEGCPSSFESSRGNILYMIEAVIQISHHRHSHKIQRPFNVLEVVEIDYIGTRNPIHEQTRAVVGACLCHSRCDGDVGFTGEVLHSAFLMKELVPVKMQIDNRCGYEVYARCEILEKILYLSSRSSYEVENILCLYQTENFRAYVNSGILYECLQLPRVRPAVTKSTIIKSQFFIRFLLIIPKKNKEAVIEIPLWIGNTPLPDPPVLEDSD